MKTLLKKVVLPLAVITTVQLFASDANNQFPVISNENPTADPVTDCPPEEVDGLLVFEAERFDLTGLPSNSWKIVEGDPKASGGKYLEFSGTNGFGTPRPEHDISYTFKINNPGTYSLKWIMRQPPEEAGSDLSNDAWIYFSDDIGRGNDNLVLTRFYKFVGRSDTNNNFVLNGQGEIDHKPHSITAVFPSAGEYTLNLSGRSHGFQVDRIILSKGIAIDDLPSKVALIEETNTCEEEDVNPTGEEVGLVNPFTTFDDTALEVPLRISYKSIENRTITAAITELNGTVIKSASTDVAAATDETDLMIALDTPLEWNQTYIIVTSLKSSTGETIRESKSSFSVLADKNKNSVTFVDFPEIINSVNNTVRISYDINKDRDVLLQLKRNTWTVKTIRLKLPKGQHERDLQINLGTLPGDGANYFWRAMIRVVKAPFKGNLHTHDSKLVKVDKDYVDLSSDSFDGKQEVKITTFPNPFVESLSVQLPNTNDFETIEILDIAGNVVLSKEVKNNSTLDLDLNVPTGIYLLKMVGANTFAIQKIIKN